MRFFRPDNSVKSELGPRISFDAVTCFLVRPDRRHSFADWLRMLLEDMLVSTLLEETKMNKGIAKSLLTLSKSIDDVIVQMFAEVDKT